jgi:serine/threonine protein kinase
MTGRTISHYRIVEKLGEGGMGVVYKAEDTKLLRPVALKFLSASMLGSESDKQRFLREAQASAMLDHPNIAAVHEIDEVDGQTFIAMTYVDGPSLAARMAERALNVDEALDVGIQIAQGLGEAHGKGIVHRDIKGANILLTARGQVKITDFGLAHLAGRSRLTKSGTTLGTPAYMSPELALGNTTDRRSDIWSLGVVLYEMLTGRLPFDGQVEQVMVYSIINEDPQPLSALRRGLPADLGRIVLKALAKRPEERYQHTDDLAVDLRRVRKQLELCDSSGAHSAESGSAVRPSLSATGAFLTATSLANPASHSWRPTVPLLVALLVLALGLIVFLLWRLQATSAADPVGQYLRPVYEQAGYAAPSPSCGAVFRRDT